MLNIEIKPHKDRRSLLTIFVDDDPWRNIHTSIFGTRPTLPKNCLLIDEFSKSFTALEYKQAKNYAIRRLSQMNLPSAKLAKSLKERLVSEPTITLLIQNLSEEGFINDQEWVNSFVRVQSQRKMGPRAIAMKLASKGMASEQADEILRESLTDEKQRESIKQLLASRYRTRDLKDFHEKRKVIASLLRRGYDYSLVQSILDE